MDLFLHHHYAKVPIDVIGSKDPYFTTSCPKLYHLIQAAWLLGLYRNPRDERGGESRCLGIDDGVHCSLVLLYFRYVLLSMLICYANHEGENGGAPNFELTAP